MIAPLAATRSGDVAFIVLLAGTGVTGEEIVMRQGELIARAAEVRRKTDRQRTATPGQMFEIIRQEPDRPRRRKN